MPLSSFGKSYFTANRLSLGWRCWHSLAAHWELLPSSLHTRLPYLGRPESLGPESPTLSNPAQLCISSIQHVRAPGPSCPSHSPVRTKLLRESYSTYRGSCQVSSDTGGRASCFPTSVPLFRLDA